MHKKAFERNLKIHLLTNVPLTEPSSSILKHLNNHFNNTKIYAESEYLYYFAKDDNITNIYHRITNNFYADLNIKGLDDYSFIETIAFIDVYLQLKFNIKTNVSNGEYYLNTKENLEQYTYVETINT